MGLKKLTADDRLWHLARHGAACGMLRRGRLPDTSAEEQKNVSLLSLMGRGECQMDRTYTTSCRIVLHDCTRNNVCLSHSGTHLDLPPRDVSSSTPLPGGRARLIELSPQPAWRRVKQCFLRESFQQGFCFNGQVPHRPVESAVRAAFKLISFSRIHCLQRRGALSFWFSDVYWWECFRLKVSVD